MEIRKGTPVVLILILLLVGAGLGVGLSMALSEGVSLAGNTLTKTIVSTLTINAGTGPLSTITLEKIVSLGVGQEYYYSSSCTEPTVGYSTITRSSYQYTGTGNISQGLYSVVISTSSSTNLTPYTTYYLSTSGNCIPNANGTVSATSGSK